MGWISHWGSSYYGDVMEQYGAAQRNNATIIYNYLLSKGFKRPAICAMLGNMMTESYLNPGQWQHGYSPYDGNKYNGMGLVGWTPYWRITDWLTSHGYNLNNADSYGYGMLDKLVEECFDAQEITWIATNSYPLSFAQFATDESHDISWLANAFLYNYERPATTPQPARAQQALQWSTILPTSSGSLIEGVVELVLSRVGKNTYTQTAGLREQVFSGYSDCSSLMWKCFEKGAGIYIGSWTGEQITNGTQIYNNTSSSNSLPSNIMRGDLVFFEGSPGGHGSGSSNHVEMYIGNGQFCGHGSGVGPTIKTASTYIAQAPQYGNYFSEVRRYLDPAPPPTTGVKLLRWIPM